MSGTAWVAIAGLFVGIGIIWIVDGDMSMWKTVAIMTISYIFGAISAIVGMWQYLPIK